MKASAAPVPLAGPKGSLLLGNLSGFGRNPLRFLENCVVEFGDVVALRFGNKRVYLLNNPSDIEQVLATQSRNFRKTIGYRTPFMRRLFGYGLLTSEGELWTRQRRLAQPAFHRDRIANYANVIVRYTEEMLADWKPNDHRNIHEAMMRLTTRVVVRTLFDSDVPREIDSLGEASEAVMKRFTMQWSWWRLLLGILPSPTQWRFEKVMRQLDEYIFGLIAERRRTGRDAGDLLSMLLLARDEDGSGMEDQQLRDELTTLMVAGLDTTALALSWGFYLLAKNPDAAEKLSREVRTVLGTRAAGFSDLPQLPYTEMVIKESMRLFPPAWLVGREAMVPSEISGTPIAAGDSLVVSQWLQHRDGRNFPEPLKFSPERWTDEASKKLPKFVYFPFGGGPRICIGSSFAMMEAVLVLATVAQKFRVLTSPAYEVEPWASITLQPRGGIWLHLAAANESRDDVDGPDAMAKTGAGHDHGK